MKKTNGRWLAEESDFIEGSKYFVFFNGSSYSVVGVHQRDGVRSIDGFPGSGFELMEAPVTTRAEVDYILQKLNIVQEVLES